MPLANLYHSKLFKYSLFISLNIVTFFTYQPSLSSQFIFDDYANIVTNQSIQISNISLKSLKSVAYNGYNRSNGRPLSTISFSLNYYFFGNNNKYYLIINLLIHCINGLGIFILSILIIRIIKADQSIHYHYYFSFCLTALWLIHPINFTSISYAVQRMTSLASLFSIYGLIAYLYFRCNTNQSKLINSIGAILSLLIASLLASLSKEIGVLIPIYIAIIEFTFFYLLKPNKIILCLLLSIFLLAAITLIAHLEKLLSLFNNYDNYAFNLWQRLLTEFKVLWLYIKLILLPHSTNFAIFHDDINISWSIKELPTMLAIISLLASTFMAIQLRQKYPWISFGILFFLAGHLLESTILPLEIAHEHRNYLPAFGLLFTFSYLIFNLPSKTKLIPISLFIGLFSYFSLITYHRAIDRKDDTFIFIEASNHPKSTRSQHQAIRTYYHYANSFPEHANHFNHLALMHINLLKKHKPDEIIANINRLYIQGGDIPPPPKQWINEIIEKLKTLPITVMRYNSLLSLNQCHMSHRCKLKTADMQAMLHSILQNHNFNNGYKRASVYSALSQNYLRYQNIPAALKYAKLANFYQPNNLQLRINYATLLFIHKDLTKLKTSLKITPILPLKHHERKNLEKSIRHFIHRLNTTRTSPQKTPNLDR